MAALAMSSACAAVAAGTSGFRSSLAAESCCFACTLRPPTSVRLKHLVWKSKKQRRPVASSFTVLAAAAAAVDEAVVTTEAVPRPKKVGKGIVRLRLTRMGRKKRPFFRIVATHHSWRRDGEYIELLGHYNPLHAKDDLGIVVKADRIKYWLGVGAQPSDTVTGILHKVGILKKVEQAAQ